MLCQFRTVAKFDSAATNRVQAVPVESRREVLDIFVDALLGAASQSFKAGNFRESIGFLKEALQVEPQSDKAKQDLFGALIASGRQSLSQGNTSETINIFSEALKLVPHSIEAYMGLARAFLKEGDFGKALQATRDALKIDPSNVDLQSLLRELTR